MSNATAAHKRWVKRLQRCIDAAPKDVWIFIGSGTFCVMQYDKNGERRTIGGTGTVQDGGLDPFACIATITGIEADGGDW